MCLFLNFLNGWLFSRASVERKEKHKGSQTVQSLPPNTDDVDVDETSKTNQGAQKQHYGSNILIEQFTIASQDFKLKNLEKEEEEETTMSTNESSDAKQQPQEAQDGSRKAATSDVTQIGDNNNQQLNNERQQASGNEADFRIRTANRRHLDFDGQYDLGDVGAAERSSWSGPFHFIQAADSQFGMIDSYIYNRTEPGWSEEIKLCENLVRVCNQMEPKPKFMIICGDLVDAWPSTETRRQQVVDFKRIFSKLDHKIPLVCVCGNHDVGDEPTISGIEEYRRNFGDDYFYFTMNDVLFIVINSQFYQHRAFVEDYASKQDEWLESMLAKCKLFKYSIVFEHIPWFLEHSDEENDYFNIKKEVRLKWLKKFKDAGVTKIMCGHYHRNAGGWYEDMELVVTSAIGAQCGKDKSGVRIVRVLEKTIEHQYYDMPDIPTKVELSQG